jgi:hypothetical protein
MPQAFQSSADIGAMIARVTPAVLALLGDGAPHRRQEIVDALADRHPKDDVVLTLVRLTVTGRLVATGNRYALAGTAGADP